MASEASSKHRKPAGKHPTLRPKTGKLAVRPKTSEHTSSPRRASNPVPKKKKASEPIPWQTATRRVLTRSQSKVFPLRDLPPELRNLIYHHAASAFSANKEEPIDLKTLKLPPALSPSMQVRSEALPFFFSSNHFKLRVKSNYCVFRRHFHHFEHVRYSQTGTLVLSRMLTHNSVNMSRTGTVALSPLLLACDFDDHVSTMTTLGTDEEDGTEDGQGDDVALRDEWIRFKHVTFDVDCVCCAPGKQIAKLELGVQGASQAVVNCTMTVKPREGFDEAKASMELIFGSVRNCVEAIGARKAFNGFTVADLVDVGASVSYDGGGGARDRRGGHREH